MMVGICMSLRDAKATWRHNTVCSDATFVIAVATTAEVRDSAIVICGHIGLGSTLTTLAEFVGTFAFAFPFAGMFDVCPGWLGIRLVRVGDLFMTKATLGTKVALASSHEMTAFFDMTLRLS